MQVNCPSCGSQIESDDMNLTELIGKCRRCHALVDLREFIAHPAEPIPSPTVPVQGEFPIPTRFNIADDGHGFTISWRWFDGEFILLALFLVFWDGILIELYSGPWANIGFLSIIFIFTLPHAVLGIWLTYNALAGFLNRTTIRVGSAELTVRHGPLPFFGNRRIPVEQIDQLYCEQAVHQSNADISYSYEVSALDEGRKKSQSDRPSMRSL